MKIDGIELLEQKIRKAAEMIRTLRQEREALERRLGERESEIEELQAAAAEAAREDVTTELERLREERRDILARVDAMLALLDEADESPGEEQGLLSALEGVE